MEYRIVRALSHADEDQKYGIPEQKKFPMPDARHVRSAIRFFNYVDSSHEKELANAILARMREYGLTFKVINVGEDNRFSKYIPESGELTHHGIIGMKWGIRRFQNPDGSLTPEGQIRYAKQLEKEATREATKADIKKRKRASADREKLLKMAKKHPDWLTDQELDMLNNRKNKETNFDRNYNKKTQKKIASEERKDIRKALVSEVVTPAVVELGKATVASMIGGGDLGSIAARRIATRLFDLSDVNKYWRGETTGGSSSGGSGSGKKKPEVKKTSGSFKKK